MSDTRRTLGDFFHSRGSTTSNKISFNLTDTDNDGLVSLNNEDDLGIYVDEDGVPNKLVEGFLGDYLNFIVTETNNIYRPGKGNQLTIEKHHRGRPIITDDTPQVNLLNKKTFIDTNKPESSDKLGKNYLDKISNSQQISIGDYLDKTGDDPGKSGNNLFKDIEGTDINTYSFGNEQRSDNDVLRSIEDYIINNNRFGNLEGNISPYFQNTGENENLEENLNYKMNDRFGESPNKSDATVKIERLKNLGAELLQKMSFNTDSRVQDGNVYTKNNGNDYRAKYSSFYPTGSDGNTIRQDKGQFVNQNSDSFKTTYDDEVNFYKKNKQIVKLNAIVASRAVYSIYHNLYKDVIDSLTIENSETELKKEAEIAIQSGDFLKLYGKAKSLPVNKLEYLRGKYITQTIYPYSQCVERGLEVCLGTNEYYEGKWNLIKDSPGYWLSICDSIIKQSNKVLDELEDMSDESDQQKLRQMMYGFTSDASLRFFNVMATVGDISLRSTHGKSLDTDMSLKENASFYDVDALDDLPGNRVGKSKMKSGKRKNQLSWAQSTVPSAYLLPMNTVRASMKMDNGPNKPNPVRAHFGSDLVESTYMSVNNDGSGGRIPSSVIKTLEDQLDAEYVPFYIQDLRTNEIISFHAFLSSLTDQITPNFNSQGGYGRMDNVHIYNNTSRSVSCTFTLMATSKEDFDNMWYKINKITTLLYPQWTEGSQVERDGAKFIQPFSQVVGASPIVRLRIGDVIKSNYSKYNLGRIFGIGNKGTKIKPGAMSMPDLGELGQEVLISAIGTIFGSPMQFESNSWVQSGKDNLLGFAAVNAGSSFISNLLVNGFVNPLALNPIMNQLKDPSGKDIDFWLNFPGINGGYNPVPLPLLLKPNVSNGYLFETGERIKFNRSITVRVDKKIIEESKDKYGNTIYRTKYKCNIMDPELIEFDEGDLWNKAIWCYHEDLHPLPDTVYLNTLLLPGLMIIGGGTGSVAGYVKELISQFAKSIPGVDMLGGAIDAFGQLFESDSNKFLNSESNPFTRAFETTMGRGLAGKLGGITFDWLDQSFPWETDYNSRAPMGVKISFSLDVIHDLPPGLDYAGYNRAPLYNVGRIMKDISGDVYNDGGFNSEAYFNKSRTIKKG